MVIVSTCGNFNKRILTYQMWYWMLSKLYAYIFNAHITALVLSHFFEFYCEVQKLVFFRQTKTRRDGIKFAHTTNEDGKRIIIISGLLSNNRGGAGAGEVVVVVFSIRALLYSEEL